MWSRKVKIQFGGGRRVYLPGAIHPWVYHSAETTQTPIISKNWPWPLCHSCSAPLHICLLHTYPVLLRWWRRISATVCCFGQLLVWSPWNSGSQGAGQAAFLIQEGKLSESLPLWPCYSSPFCSFAAVTATWSLLFHFQIPLIRLHLVCPRSFWCNPPTVDSGSSRDFGALPRMLGFLLAVFPPF